ncbi:MAG: TrmB family transcriptional regulator [Promethearchaeota archaeon]
MSENLIEDLKDFLNDSNLSTYETNAYIALLMTSKIDPPTARKISKQSNVPSGRIYEVLEDLKTKGLVEIIESRPKKYIAISLNKAVDNLINYQIKENKQRIGYLYEKAKLLEIELYDSDKAIRKEPSKLFWSTVYGKDSIFALYRNLMSTAKQEMLCVDFINKWTVKILSHANFFYIPLKEMVDRGVRVKCLWCFEYDNRPLNEEQKEQNSKIFYEITEVIEKKYVKSTRHKSKYINYRMPIYFDIIDKTRVLLKLPNPLKPFQIFACMNIVDPNLAEELRKKYLTIWNFEGLEK